MALRNILKDGDDTLKKRSRAVTDFNKRLWELLDDMKDTMLEGNGLGLAAPQVGILRRAFLVIDTKIDDDGEEYDELLELINPELIAESGEQSGMEGCLSVPGVWGIVTRPMQVKVRAQDRYGEYFEVEGEGITARAFCHEYAHLEGQLFTEIADKILSSDEIAALLEESDAEDEKSREKSK